MSALNMKPGNVAAAVLIVGAAWFLSTRQARAASLPGNGRSPLNPSPEVRRALAPFLISPSQAGATVQQQANDAARNAGLISGLGGLFKSWQPALQPSVTSAIPGDMRISEKASYDVGDSSGWSVTAANSGDFRLYEHGYDVPDYIATNPAGFIDPIDYASADSAPIVY